MSKAIIMSSKVNAICLYIDSDVKMIYTVGDVLISNRDRTFLIID